MMRKTAPQQHSGFAALVLMYFTTFAGEGLLVMYLFNNVRVNGLDIGVSAMFSLVSYVPSLFLIGVATTTHSRFPVRARLRVIAIARAMACVALVVSGAYMSIWVAVLFILVMEMLWYALMPCFDELENATIHGIGTGRGEAILTITLQAAMSAALLTGGLLFDLFGAPAVLASLAALQLVPVIACPSEPPTTAPQKNTAPTSEPAPPATAPSLVPLLVVLGIASTIPQLANILFPVKTFTLTELSTVAGGIDAAYSIGALAIALIGLSTVVHRLGTPRTAGVFTMLTASGALTVFAVSSSPLVLAGAYLCLGFVTTLCRVRIRAETFSRLKGAGSGPWYSRITNTTLACCTTGAVVLGITGYLTDVTWCYAVIVAVAIAGAIASALIRSPAQPPATAKDAS